jgi:3-hydroxyisobutyrate dehydrogenase
MIANVGYIGLGNMGRPIATNVVEAGYSLIVYDIREEPLKDLAAVGAEVAESSREVGAYSDLVELSVVDDEQVESVVLGPGGVLEGAKPGTVIAIHSTIHPDTARKVGEAARPKGVAVLDAAVSGGAAGARARTLCYMVGGERTVFEQCRPVFETSGKHIFYMGGLGMGAATKAAQQAMTVVHLLAASEGFALAEKAGVDLDAFQELVRVSSGQSSIADHWQERRWDPRMAELFYLGLQPILKLGHDLDVPLPGAALTQQLLRRLLKTAE